MNLYDKTTAAHHDAEHSEFGCKLVNQTVSKQEWANWLKASLKLQAEVDTYFPSSLKRSPQMMEDLFSMLPIRGRKNREVPTIIAKAKESPEYLGGLLYLLGGATLKGGAVIAKKMTAIGYPCTHLEFSRAERTEGNDWLKTMREFADLEKEVNECFADVNKMMQECLENE